ncbi:hypothetical protein CCMSSC00406_0009639 [Pleurotus cornucopiae]|uniref:Uncharacterized protein n=1 Tax=Pleurotus cornucopiae TaxID=5321 RepID=A0ACB7J942_PLECO|nr:hypothetical protein CCMSSC00406_0009639 [Pleurotus cornucopiae]
MDAFSSLRKRSSITQEQADALGILAYACTIPGTILCFLVLLAYGAAALSPKGRPHLDRVSFRLLCYSLFFNVLYGIAFSVTAAQTGPGSLCNLGAFAVNFTLNFAMFFTTCIAINLQLVLVHRVNGKAIEKYYVIVVTLLSIVLTVLALGLNQFGWDETNFVCWFKNPDEHTKVQWLIGTQSIWIALAATIETICSVTVLVWMAKFQLNTRFIQKGSDPSFLQTSGATGHRSEASSSAPTMLSTQARKYRGVILRIVLYPVVSLLINCPRIGLDIFGSVKGVHTELDYRLLVADLVLYGLRPFAYALLACNDPSFVRAVQDIRGIKVPTSDLSGETDTMSRPKFASQRPTDSTFPGELTVNLELQTVSHGDDISMDKPGKHDMFIHEESGTSTGRLASKADTRRTFTDSEWDDKAFERHL